MSAQKRVASKHSLGNDVKMAEKPDIIVSIDLGTTYTGKIALMTMLEIYD